MKIAVKTCFKSGVKIVKQKLQAISGELKTQFKILGSCVIVFWAVFIVNKFLFGSRLNTLGILPHYLIGLRGILFAPFLHGSFYHVAANTLPFIVLGWFVMLRNIKDFYFVSFMSALIGGVGTWVFGRPDSVHIGASGIIFGYLGYLLFRGYFERSFVAIAISLIIGITYGGLIWGLLPTRSYISWEAHLFGFIGGIVAAKLLAPKT
ncbi:MAG: rhomboid family intramembrane serine protease [Pseudanabaena sp.]|jgi:membrane associated rhomboid family serine protease|nr:rhomboid family intramembrane serine protease [Pseudanabaena sp. M53BS1SP1A06MG]MCA6584261.1 rhomboid family intramembrane serine protease [Pseudanabaena sp. M34BS1SP1A06MG]MCA6587609.1 rhomboid family intramembrane serine protease [Pseudanabaena sp. M051S1SP1A06QC]MCA6590233.1 rhomboid family intramembrane serine protease [Pseudanabaena sp. M109S1SP1A06QC]MCA6593576.1 rhomboid family intramembrane serine protease [Pseudanabaena sp. M38BS1SP1A06MG]MCA6601514.1 rhomboid family intramembrane 